MLNNIKCNQRSNHQLTLPSPLPSSSVTAISNSQPLTSQWINKWIEKKKKKQKKTTTLFKFERAEEMKRERVHLTWVRCHPFKFIIIIMKYYKICVQWNTPNTSCQCKRAYEHDWNCLLCNRNVLLLVNEWTNGWLSEWASEQNV